MLLGILSDTHGQAGRAIDALRVLESAGATAFVHCGDLCGLDVLDALAGRQVWFAWGNMDLEAQRHAAHARTLGLTPPTAVPVRFDFADRSFAVFHGHEPAFAQWLGLAQRGERDALLQLAGGRIDYVLYGHTHAADDDRVAGVRWINPGALHRARDYTVALLDPAADRVQFLRVPGGQPCYLT